MLKAKRGNKTLQIKEWQVSRYLGLGYSIIREDGTVLRTYTENDIPELEKRIKTLEKELTDALAQNDILTKQIAEIAEQNEALEVKTRSYKKSAKSVKGLE